MGQRNPPGKPSTAEFPRSFSRGKSLSPPSVLGHTGGKSPSKHLQTPGYQASTWILAIATVRAFHSRTKEKCTLLDMAGHHGHHELAEESRTTLPVYILS